MDIFFDNALKNLQSFTTQSFRYNYQYNTHQVSVLVDFEHDNQRIYILITTPDAQVCEPIFLYQDENDNLCFDKYWNPETFPFVREVIMTVVDGRYTVLPFWQNLVERLEKLSEQAIEQTALETAQDTANRYLRPANTAIYPHHLRRANITPSQAQKICQRFGKIVYFVLRQQGINLIFTRDPRLARTIIINDLEIVG